MSLTFRILTLCYIYVMIGLPLYILTTGILGRKIRWKYLAGFCGYVCVMEWMSMLIQLVTYTSWDGIPYDDIVLFTIHAAVLGGLMHRGFQIPVMHAVTAAILGAFIYLTSASVITEAVNTYSPLFDRQHFLVFVRLYLPYTFCLLLSMFVSVILKKAEFYRYFAALFANRGRAVLILMVSYILMCSLPVLDILAPGRMPDAGYAVFFFALIVVSLFLIQFAAMYAAGQDKSKAQEETILQQQAHMELLEELQQEIRAFRHDFTNLFSGLTLQAQAGDLKGIQDFMKKTSSYFDEKLGSEIAQMDGLNRIEMYALRSLLTAKLAKMRQEKIKTVLEVLRPVKKDQAMDGSDLLRALGILLDNAIEAVPAVDGKIHIVLLQEEKELYLAVANNYEKTPDMTALNRKGYTTKGKGHGTGLSSYRKIIARSAGCASRTYLREEMFVQELHIPVK